ncbi:MAG: oxidoreductase [Chthonomonadaceae bacterium]|nr:oxidoreductase [Chthonomonadaceae bacterium]
MNKVIVISGASSGFGALSARALADAGHTVYAGMRDAAGRNAPAVQDAQKYASDHSVTLRTIEMDVSNQASVDAAIQQITTEAGQIDVVIHNAGHMVLGPVEAFTVEQLAEMYDTNVLSTQRINRAVLPQMRKRHDGLLLWIGSTSTFGGTPPYLGPYFAAKAGEDQLAKSYAVELARFGIDSVIVLPGSFTSGTNHFAHAMHPADTATEQAYEEKYAGLMDQVGQSLAKLSPPDANISEVTRAIVKIVDTPKGQRPFRTTVDPANDGSEQVTDVAERIRSEFYQRIGFADLLSTAV